MLNRFLASSLSPAARKVPSRRMATRSAFPATVASKLCEYIDSMPDRSQPVVRLSSPDDIRANFQEIGVPLSLLGEQLGESPEKLSAAIDIVLKYSVRTAHPLFFNQLYGGADPTSIAADWVSTATNTNCHTYEVAPVYTVIETELLAKVASIVGGDYTTEHDGLFVPGGSLSNLYGMHLSHSRADPDYLRRGAAGGPRCVAFTSDQSHYSYLKSARLTGLGSDNLISVATDNKGCMIPEELEAAIAKAKEAGHLPFFVGATAGTTVLGAYDPFDEISSICKRHNLWLHVDACWGGGALLSDKYRHWMKGIEGADSLAWNPHKMSGSTLQCSVFITKHAKVLKATNATSAAYLFQPDKLYTEYDSGDKTIQCGRKTDMFKLWLQWKADGDAGMRAQVDRCFGIADFMADKIRSDQSGAWKLVYEPSCANVCFWYVPKKLRPFNWEEASQEQIAGVHKVAPYIKDRMQKTGDALIGFQAVNGRPNFFRIVFAGHGGADERDIEGVMERIAAFGEESVAEVESVEAPSFTAKPSGHAQVLSQ